MTDEAGGEALTGDRRRHKEAFALMWYACPCGHRERIWNSRDGVTPYGGLLCTSCGGKGLERRGLSHIDFYLDRPAPNHKLLDGQQFFRDGTACDAIEIIERRIVIFAGRGQAVPSQIADKLRRDAVNQTGEWQPGWPMIDRFSTTTTTAALPDRSEQTNPKAKP